MHCQFLVQLCCLVYQQLSRLQKLLWGVDNYLAYMVVRIVAKATVIQAVREDAPHCVGCHVRDPAKMVVIHRAREGVLIECDINMLKQ